MTDAAVILFFENALVLLKESTEIRIIVVIGHRMLVDDLLFGLVWYK
jgi:ascorbate-specific PTS system EIIC-type component UlaA